MLPFLRASWVMYSVRSTRTRSSVPLLEPGSPRFFGGMQKRINHSRVAINTRPTDVTSNLLEVSIWSLYCKAFSTVKYAPFYLYMYSDFAWARRAYCNNFSPKNPTKTPNKGAIIMTAIVNCQLTINI